MDAKSTPEERRASIERFRAVGQTFADGIASFRDRMTTTTRAEHANTPLSPGEGEAISPAPGAAQSACEHGDEDTHGMNESPPPLKKDMERLQNILFATERRVEMANNEVESVRAQHRALASSHERATKALDTLRAEHDGAVSRMRDACERGERATGEMARLRGEVLELERALHSRDDKLHQAERRATTDRNRAAALETVSMSLRRRVAISEEKMVDARTVHDAAVAREHAESELVAAKGETERWRARASATDTVRDRAGRAELAEHDLRKRVSLLEREISSRDVLLKQGLGERKKLKEFMSKYERELDEKDATIAKLRATIASRRRPLTRKDAVSEREVSENGSTRSTTWEKNVSATQTLGTQNLGTQTLGTQNLGTQNLGGTQNHDTTRYDYTQQDAENWDESLQRPSRRSVQSDTYGENVDDEEFGQFMAASPLLREVEEAHAALQAAFQDTDQAEPEYADDHIDLVERMKLLDASFRALEQARI